MAPHLFMKFLSKAIYCSKLKTLYLCNLLSLWSLSNCCDPLWDTFHIPMIKITLFIHMILHKNISHIHTYHPTNKTPCYSWLLSPSYHFKMKDMGYAKRNKCHAQESMMKKKESWTYIYIYIYKERKKESWTHEGPSIQERERER